MRQSRLVPAAVALALLISAAPAGAAGVKTVGQFVGHSTKFKTRFVYHYLRTHDDACTPGHPTSRRVAHNIDDVIAKAIHVGRNSTDGSTTSAGTPIGSAIRHLEANIGC